MKACDDCKYWVRCWKRKQPGFPDGKIAEECSGYDFMVGLEMDAARDAEYDHEYVADYEEDDDDSE